MHDTEVFAASLASARDGVARAVRGWHAQGHLDEVLALLVDGKAGGPPTVTALSRTELEQSILAFEPTIAIEFAKQKPGHAPAVVDLPDRVRRIFWIDLVTFSAAPAF